MEDSDLHISITRGSGPGGQHKNKVETCVTITHIPTGLKERCQDSRSRMQNIKIAKQRLENKLISAKQDKIQEIKNGRRLFLIKNPKIIRTYNFTRNEVFDYRTKKTFDLKKFMKGNIQY